MNKITIVGGGFGGLAAAEELHRAGRDMEITLIDKQGEFNFLPLLPDVIGRGIKPEFLFNKIEGLSKKKRFNFINEEVISFDLEKKEVLTVSGTSHYDYLIIACGSETNFYGNDNVRKYAYKLDNVWDAQTILQALERDKFDTYIISGGGYTGIEIAANLRIYLNKKSKVKRIIIAERAPSILGPLPEWMKDYVSRNLKELNIGVSLNTMIDKIEKDRIFLSSKEVFNNAMLIWAAGVKIPDFAQNLNVDRTAQGRLKVDEYLRLNERCFVVGDAASFLYKERPLRMAVQFAIFQGQLAASNILNLILGLPLTRCKPLDLGYIIPMANNKSCGIILGVRVKGLLATILHFLMCIYRSRGLRNKLGIIGSLAKGGGK